MLASHCFNSTRPEDFDCAPTLDQVFPGVDTHESRVAWCRHCRPSSEPPLRALSLRGIAGNVRKRPESRSEVSLRLISRFAANLSPAERNCPAAAFAAKTSSTRTCRCVASRRRASSACDFSRACVALLWLTSGSRVLLHSSYQDKEAYQPHHETGHVYPPGTARGRQRRTAGMCPARVIRT